MHCCAARCNACGIADAQAVLHYASYCRIASYACIPGIGSNCSSHLLHVCHQRHTMHYILCCMAGAIETKTLLSACLCATLSAAALCTLDAVSAWSRHSTATTLLTPNRMHTSSTRHCIRAERCTARRGQRTLVSTWRNGSSDARPAGTNTHSLDLATAHTRISHPRHTLLSTLIARASR
jgi:hypothetical protein